MMFESQAFGVKMVLSGEGADEILGGYLYFHKCPNRAEMQARPPHSEPSTRHSQTNAYVTCTQRRDAGPPSRCTVNREWISRANATSLCNRRKTAANGTDVASERSAL